MDDYGPYRCAGCGQKVFVAGDAEPYVVCEGAWHVGCARAAKIRGWYIPASWEWVRMPEPGEPGYAALEAYRRGQDEPFLSWRAGVRARQHAAAQQRGATPGRPWRSDAE